jgi:hypothetical protein
MSNGESDSDQEQETSGSHFGTKFTVELGEIELTDEQRENISSEIVRIIMERIGMPVPPSGDDQINLPEILPEIIELYSYRRGYRRGGL